MEGATAVATTAAFPLAGKSGADCYTTAANYLYFLCQKCGKLRPKPKVKRPGICRDCYMTRGRKQRTDKPFGGLSGKAELGCTTFRPKVPQPTLDTFPGTLAREAVYTARLLAGEALFHPQDARYSEA